MTCPKCNGEQLCPCKSCAERNTGKVVWRWINGELIACGHCGYTAHVDHWQDLEMALYAQQDNA